MPLLPLPGKMVQNLQNMRVSFGSRFRLVLNTKAQRVAGLVRFLWIYCTGRVKGARVEWAAVEIML